jgi:hypothetical protein
MCEPTDLEFEDATVSVRVGVEARLHNKNREVERSSIGDVRVIEQFIGYGKGAKVRIVIDDTDISLKPFGFADCGWIVSSADGDAVPFGRPLEDFLAVGSGGMPLEEFGRR